MKVEDFLKRLDERLDRFDERYERQELTIRTQATVLSEQAVVLREHIRRTAALEALVQELRKEHDTHVKDAVTWPFVGKVVAGLGGAGAAAKAIWETLKPHP